MKRTCNGCGRQMNGMGYDGKFCNKSCKKQKMDNHLRQYWNLRRELGK